MRLAAIHEGKDTVLLRERKASAATTASRPGQGGDIFTFVQKMEGVDFMGSLKILAEKAGVEVINNPASAKDRDRVERLREAMTQATQFFSVQLLKDSDPYTYALSRGLRQTISSWSLGFAPDTWRALLEDLRQRDSQNAELA